MSEPVIGAIEQKLDDVLSRLKQTKAPEMRRTLLAEIRVLLAELDALVLKPAEPYSDQPEGDES